MGEQTAHGGDLAHLDGVAVEAGQDAMQAGEAAAVDEIAPPLEVALVRLAGHLATEPFQVALDPRPPLLEAPVRLRSWLSGNTGATRSPEVANIDQPQPIANCGSDLHVQ